jgi:adenylate cyclase
VTPRSGARGTSSASSGSASRINRRICSGCIHALKERPGGAEVEATFLYADVRGSTALAERVGADAFRRLMGRFYAEAAARELLVGTGHEGGSPWLPVGAGIHTGPAYIGTVGEEEALDFTPPGDAVNTTARLASSAAAGEIP